MSQLHVPCDKHRDEVATPIGDGKDIVAAPEPRTEKVDVPPDWESRTLDLAIEALDDIKECDDGTVYIKWEKLPTGGPPLPVLYFLFSRAGGLGEGRLPARHLAPDGNLYPAIATVLADGPPDFALLSGSKLKDQVRRSMEMQMRRHGIRPTPMPGSFAALLEANKPKPLLIKPWDGKFEISKKPN